MLRSQFPRCLVTIALFSVIREMRCEQFWAEFWDCLVYM